MIGRKITVPTSKSDCDALAAAASQSVKEHGTIQGYKLIPKPAKPRQKTTMDKTNGRIS